MSVHVLCCEVCQLSRRATVRLCEPANVVLARLSRPESANSRSFPLATDLMGHFDLDIRCFQTAKTFDRTEKLSVAEAATPGLAKRIARRVRLRSDWEKVKIGIMEDIGAAEIHNRRGFA